MKKFLAVLFVFVLAGTFADAGPIHTIRERVRVRDGVFHRVTHRHTAIRERAKPCSGPACAVPAKSAPKPSPKKK